MKLISIDSLSAGEKLSTAIRMQDGQILLPANITVSPTHIARLKSFGIATVYIQDEFFDDVEIKPCLTDETKTNALNVMAALYKSINGKKGFKDDEIKRIAKSITSDVKSSMNEPIGIFNQYVVSDSRCIHAVNVACIVAALSIENGSNYAEIEEYTQAALLHDIMLADMADDNDFTHTELAYAMIKRQQSFSVKTYMSVAAHHERFDGKGGPKRLKDKGIPEGARILAVADMFDNLVYGYGANKAYNLHHAVEYLNMEAGASLDPVILGHFNSSIAIYPTGATVMLNNGMKAIVVSQNPRMPTRPVVRLCMPNREECLTFNLLTQNTMFIDKVEL